MWIRVGVYRFKHVYVSPSARGSPAWRRAFGYKKGIRKRADMGQRSLFAVGANVLWQVSPRTFARCVTVQVHLSASSVIAGRYALNQAAVRCIAIASAVRHSRVRFVPLPPLLNHSRECISRNLNNIYVVFLPENG